ncbi:MAG: MBL fold metallo-hydrolase [Alphaproteobacteria bacterium]|nr:MBL fold metallo-hydrolase [Alphaproteobacteria bacterium]
MRNQYYLKSNIQIMPTVCDWYAWTHLINPITAACNIVQRHLRIMSSFLEEPEIHREALKDPMMIGGPFMDVPGDNILLVQEILNKTKNTARKYLLIYDALMNIWNILDKIKEDEESLDPIYAKIPPELKGILELVYNEDNSPSIRVIEKLLYYKYATDDMQAIHLSEISEDKRPFVLSTPVFPNEHTVSISIPFSSKHLNNLYASREIGVDLASLTRDLNISDEKKDLFYSFFEKREPLTKIKNSSLRDLTQVRLKYFGHACVFIEYLGKSILIDPIISYSYSSEGARCTFEDLPDTIDYVLITHNHQDHVQLESLLQIRYKIKNIIVPKSNKGVYFDPSLKIALNSIGFENVIEIDDLEDIEVIKDIFKITAIPFFGEHGDLNIQTKSAFLVQLSNEKILFLADSNNLEPSLYQSIKTNIGKVGTIFLGMECEGAPMSWLYGPYLPKPLTRVADQSRRLNGSDCKKAISIIETFEANRVYVYAMGLEPWLGHIMGLNYSKDSPQILESDNLIEYCSNKNILSKRLFLKEEIVL